MTQTKNYEAGIPFVIETIRDIRNLSRDVKKNGSKLGLVPTMGALHDGHLSLVRTMLNQTDQVAVSIFVNPAQFGPDEDLDAYPRQLEQDIALLKREGVHIVYCPHVNEMYPDGFSSNIHVGGLSDILCGAYRPGHFDGVATVVAKLLLQVEPDKAIFGEKDYQQLCVIRRLVKDLNIPCEVLAGEIIRDEFGLALSSRNSYLNDTELKTARQMNKVLATVKSLIERGENIPKALDTGRKELLKKGFDHVDYVELRDENSLKPLMEYKPKARLLVAAKIGPARLIDNMEV